MKMIKEILTPFLVCAALIPSAYSSTLYFDGDIDSNIQTAENWSGDILPASGTHAGIVGGSTNVFFTDRYITTLDITFTDTSSIGNIVTSATRMQNGTVFSFLDSSSWDNLSQNVIIGYTGTVTVNWDSSGTLSALGGAKLDVGRAGNPPCFLNQSDGLIEVGTHLQVLSGSIYALSGGSMSIAGYIDAIDVGAYIDLLTTGTTGTLSVVNGGADYTSALQGFIDSGKIRINGVEQTGYSHFDIHFDGSKTTIFASDGTSQPGPQILSFTASEDLVASNTTVALDWSTTNATYASIDQGIGEVATTGSTNVVITAPVTFTLTATNEFGNTTSSVSIGVTTPRPPASSGPNIVFVLVDDWGWTDHDNSNMAQGFQSDFYQTPNFSRLVDAGVAFTSTYAQPNCAPTRGALLTGQYSCRSGNGVYNVTSLNRAGRTTYTTPADQGDEHANGDEQTITIGEAFINSGYVTAHFGKYHAGASDPDDPTFPLNQGFDFNYGGKNDGAPGTYFASGGVSSIFGSRIGPELDPFAADYSSTYITDNLAPYSTGNNPTTLDGTAKHLTDAMGDAFISFMNNHQSGSMSNYPIYAQIHFYAVHGPIQPRPDLKTKYDGLPGGTLHNDPSYAALVEGMDHSLGRVMDYLADPNGDGDIADSIAENTLLVFCSDNGGTAESNLPLRLKKGTHFDGGIRVPCVISMPGTIPTNKVSDTLVHIVDFYPTMLDFAGGVFPNAVTHPLDGVSLHDHLLDPDNMARNRGPVFYHFPGYMDTRAYNCSVVIKNIEGKRYKYIYSYDPYYDPSDEYDQYQLYCLTDDIGETVNLLDYIDLEVSGTDPSTTEEYWNYILYKDIGAELAANLNNWLDHGSTDPDGPADPTWTPIYATYKDTFPGIAPELVGQETGPAPASIPELVIPEGQIFRVLNAEENIGADEVTLEFRSDAGFNYAIEASSNLVDWVEIAANIVGQADSTTHVASDPAISTAGSRFYRAILKAN